jgi:hypothetical protein
VDRACNSDGWCWEDPLPLGGEFRVIHGSDPTNVWAVSYSVVLQFDGTNWIFHEEAREPTAVWAFSKSDVWVGTNTGVRHWNGQTWDRNDLSPRWIVALWGAAPNDLWAVAWGGGPGDGKVEFRHWNGQAWTAMEQPSLAGLQNLRFRMTGTSTSDVWVLASDPSSTLPTDPGRSFALHWDGSAWTNRSLGLDQGSMWADSLAISSSEVWVAGRRFSSSWETIPSLFRWDGAAWSDVAAPQEAHALAWISQSAGNLVLTDEKGMQYRLLGDLWEPMGVLGVESAIWSAGRWPRDEPEWVAAGSLLRRANGAWVRYLPKPSVFGESWTWPDAPGSVWGLGKEIWLAYLNQPEIHHFDGQGWSEALDVGDHHSAEVAGASASEVWALAMPSGTGRNDLWGFNEAGWSIALENECSGYLPLCVRGLVATGPGQLWAVVAGLSGGLVRRESPSIDYPQGRWVRSTGAESYTDLQGTYPGNVWATSGDASALWNGTDWVPVAMPFVGKLPRFSRGPSTQSLVYEGSYGTNVYRWDGNQWLKEPITVAGNRTWGAFSSGKQHWICQDTHTVQHFDGQSWSSTTTPGYCDALWGTTDGMLRAIGVDGILRRQYPTSP